MTIILTRGLPGSGKSTWAKAWVAADPSTRLRVNRDDIRFQLYGKYWGEGVDENVVTKIEDAMVAAGVAAGKSVVIDATHLKSAWITRWRRKYPNLTIESFETPVEECKLRDRQRTRTVGADNIQSMANRYHIRPDGKLPALPEPVEGSEQWKPAPKYQEGLQEVYIVDIDGTLANHTGIRDPYDTSRYHLDNLHVNVAATVEALNLMGQSIILVSGRDEAFRGVTTEWLDKHGVDFAVLYMRPKGDVRNDAIIKHEIYHEHIAGKYNVIGVFDDRGRVLRMWRAIGLTTFAVGDTDNYNF